MSRDVAKQRVRAAQIRLTVAQAKLDADLSPWRAWMREHRVATTLLGGFASGAVFAVVPLRWLAGVGAFVGRAGFSIARAALAPAVAGAAVSGLRRGEPARDAAHAEI